MPSGGHNLKFTPALATLVVEAYAQGKGINEIAKLAGIDPMTLCRWRERDKSFDAECTRAREVGFDVQVDSMKDIAQLEPDVQRAKLICDNLKWAVSRQAPHKYGDRIDINVNQTIDLASTYLESKRKALDIEAEARVITNELPAPATDLESVAPSPDGDAEANPSDDIFG